MGRRGRPAPITVHSRKKTRQCRASRMPLAPFCGCPLLQQASLLLVQARASRAPAARAHNMDEQLCLAHLEALLRSELQATPQTSSVERLRWAMHASGACAFPPPPPPLPPPLTTTRCAALPPPRPCSIALGAVETALTCRDASQRSWPTDLAARVDELAPAFDGFVESLAAAPALAAASTVAAKVKATADAVWSK